MVAAGLWTPSVYQALFPSSAIRLRSDLNAGDWVILRNPLPVSQKSLASIALDDIVGEKSEFTGRNDGTIWIIGSKDHKNATLPPLGQFADPDPTMIEELISRAREYVEPAFGSVKQTETRLEIVDKGRAIRPAANSLLPIISQVEADDLSGSNSASSGSSNVFVS